MDALGESHFSRDEANGQIVLGCETGDHYI